MMRLSYILIMAAVMAVCKPDAGAERSKNIEKMSGLQKAVVDSIAVIDADKQDEMDVLLSGHLPSPAYAIERVEVKRRGKIIEITPLMRHDPDKIVIMMTVPYTQRVRLNKLRDESYTVRVNDARQVRSQQVSPRRSERPDR